MYIIPLTSTLPSLSYSYSWIFQHFCISFPIHVSLPNNCAVSLENHVNVCITAFLCGIQVLFLHKELSPLEPLGQGCSSMGSQRSGSRSKDRWLLTACLTFMNNLSWLGLSLSHPIPGWEKLALPNSVFMMSPSSSLSPCFPVVPLLRQRCSWSLCLQVPLRV